MLETLNAVDRALFLFVNMTLANPVTDLLMPVVTSDVLLRVGYGAAMVILLLRGDARVRRVVLFSAAALVLTDQLSSAVLKPLIARPRPCQALTDIHLLVACGGGKAMPSSHAANAFGQAALFALAAPRWRWLLLALAAVIALSRVFVGVHYVGDVAVGTLLGAAIGTAAAQGYRWVETRMAERRARPGCIPPNESADGKKARE
ncbi:MAG TPA: phosphatase PAP2 family protein [candidate division Zixibacteria bacterium]|nr:phosphatase PAP2 family protein [candidate division Zixibacteria bacterium]MDD4916569.1 phosphatase PAP2 family protein [candidate division Zixibacteria bacterium]MDM7974267.1 phosphatase PAP2 family protein [candidate division Zixibacteria bacterium]HOD65756.1 phosphatase PAP2 family protein [candidate division Zixibacteria bacterium]HOZ06924.1 phosphatase PAP2 family protein [candidate division Zixibacteria bacterium]